MSSALQGSGEEWGRKSRTGLVDGATRGSGEQAEEQHAHRRAGGTRTGKASTGVDGPSLGAARREEEGRRWRGCACAREKGKRDRPRRPSEGVAPTVGHWGCYGWEAQVSGEDEQELGLLLPAWDQGALSALTKRKRRAALRKLQDARAAASTLAVRGSREGWRGRTDST